MADELTLEHLQGLERKFRGLRMCTPGKVVMAERTWQLLMQIIPKKKMSTHLSTHPWGFPTSVWFDGMRVEIDNALPYGRVRVLNMDGDFLETIEIKATQ